MFYQNSFWNLPVDPDLLMKYVFCVSTPGASLVPAAEQQIHETEARTSCWSLTGERQQSHGTLSRQIQGQEGSTSTRSASPPAVVSMFFLLLFFFSLLLYFTFKVKTSHQISGDHFHSRTCWISSHYNFLPGSPAVTDLLPETLEAVLIPDQGYHQVGPSDLCSDMFILSVTIAFASKLEQVWYLYIYIFLIITQLPTIIVLEIKKKGFEIM